MSLDKFFKIFDRAFGVFESVLMLAAAGFGGYIVWQILSAMDVSMLIQVLGTLAGAAITTLLAWAVWSVLKLTGG